MLDVKNAADFLNLSTETIRILARANKIPAAKIGRQWRFSEDDLIKFIRSQYVTTRTESPGDEKADIHGSVVN
jgi:excisionase family DNA binding protein